MIRIEDLVFAYPHGPFRLSIPDVTIEDGEKVAFIGPSGSGKTTLLHLLAGIEVPGSGTVTTAGCEVSSMSDAERRDFRVQHVGLVFQVFELLSYLDMLDNILLPYRINSSLALTPEVVDRAKALAERVGMADKLGRYVDRLSQGERQRVAICRALLPQPRVLMADEPTGNLDPANKDRVLEMLVQQADEAGATLVTVTHEHDVLGRFDRTIDFATFHETVGAAP